jgi:hypothetical protein
MSIHVPVSADHRLRPLAAALRRAGNADTTQPPEDGVARPQLPGRLSFARQEVKAGRLKVVKYGGRVYISDEEILRYLAEAGKVMGAGSPGDAG